MTDRGPRAQVDAVATCSDDRRRVAVTLVNQHPAKAARVRLDGVRLPGGRFTVLNGAWPDAFNDVTNPSRAAPRRRDVRIADGIVELPLHLVTILENEA